MALRRRYRHELADLQQHLLRLAESVDRAIIGAVWAITHHSETEAQRVIAGDADIDALRDTIEDVVFHLLACQQPLLGSDLRSVSTAPVLAAELERIGDYAKGIAALVLRSARLFLPIRITIQADAARVGEGNAR
jgi:phosphate transport system protein